MGLSPLRVCLGAWDLRPGEDEECALCEVYTVVTTLHIALFCAVTDALPMDVRCSTEASVSTWCRAYNL